MNLAVDKDRLRLLGSVRVKRQQRQTAQNQLHPGPGQKEKTDQMEPAVLVLARFLHSDETPGSCECGKKTYVRMLREDETCCANPVLVPPE